MQTDGKWGLRLVKIRNSNWPISPLLPRITYWILPGFKLPLPGEPSSAQGGGCWYCYVCLGLGEGTWTEFEGLLAEANWQLDLRFPTRNVWVPIHLQRGVPSQFSIIEIQGYYIMQKWGMVLIATSVFYYYSVLKSFLACKELWNLDIFIWSSVGLTLKESAHEIAALVVFALVSLSCLALCIYDTELRHDGLPNTWPLTRAPTLRNWNSVLPCF